MIIIIITNNERNVNGVMYQSACGTAGVLTQLKAVISIVITTTTKLTKSTRGQEGTTCINHVVFQKPSQ